MQTVVKDVKYKGDVVATIEIPQASNWKEAEEICGDKETALSYFNYAVTVKRMNAERSKAEMKASGGVPKSVAKLLGNDPEKIAKFKELLGIEDED